MSSVTLTHLELMSSLPGLLDAKRMPCATCPGGGRGGAGPGGAGPGEGEGIGGAMAGEDTTAKKESWGSRVTDRERLLPKSARAHKSRTLHP